MFTKIIFLLFIICINQVHLYLPPEKREELINSIAQKITLESKKENCDFLNIEDDLNEPDNFQQMSYNMTELLEIMEQYDIPEKYNIFEQGEVEKDVKDQESCGCCWSFSATSALAYRYNKLGYNLSLSAQDGVSCYIRNCKGRSSIKFSKKWNSNRTMFPLCFW